MREWRVLQQGGSGCRYLISSTLLFIKNSFGPPPFDRWPPGKPTRKLSFVSESMSLCHGFLEARESLLPAPTEKMAFLRGYTSPHHAPHLLSMLPLIWRPCWVRDNSDSNDSFFSPVSELVLHDYCVPPWSPVIWSKSLGGPSGEWGPAQQCCKYLVWLVSYLCGDSTQKTGNDRILLIENSGSW